MTLSVRPGGWVAVPHHVGRNDVALLCGVYTDLRYYVIRDVVPNVGLY